MKNLARRLKRRSKTLEDRQHGLKLGPLQCCLRSSRTTNGSTEWNWISAFKESVMLTGSSTGRSAIMRPMPQVNRLNLPSAPPKRQAENKALWNKSRSLAGADFFTFGYTGRKLDEILEALASNGIRTLVDIRQYPVSMYRPELSKNNLKHSIESMGLEYIHLPELGVPRHIRIKAIEAGTREVIWEWYDENVIPGYLGRNLHRFLNSLEHPVALMCVEIDPQECHRHRLSLALEKLGLTGFDL